MNKEIYGTNKSEDRKLLKLAIVLKLYVRYKLMIDITIKKKYIYYLCSGTQSKINKRILLCISCDAH